MVVAMMADTYSTISEKSHGIYNHSILATLPQFRMSKTYGGLIASMPGLNLINFLASPIYLLIKKRETLRMLTGILAIMNYLFILIPITAIFLALNALLLPFAYLRTLALKLMLWRRQGCGSPRDFLIWLALGMPILIAYQTFDCIDFVKWSTSMETSK